MVWDSRCWFLYDVKHLTRWTGGAQNQIDWICRVPLISSVYVRDIVIRDVEITLTPFSLHYSITIITVQFTKIACKTVIWVLTLAYILPALPKNLQLWPNFASICGIYE